MVKRSKRYKQIRAALEKAREVQQAKRLALGPKLRKRDRSQNYAENNGRGHKNHTVQVDQSASTSLKSSGIENGLLLELKEEDGVEEAMEIQVDDNYANLDPLLCDESVDVSSQEDRYRCLICFCQDSNLQPLTRMLPTKSKRLTNPKEIEDDDASIVRLLKMIFQLTKRDLRYLELPKAKGHSHWEGIRICQSCRISVYEIQALADRIRECRNKIKEEIMRSSTESSSMTSLLGGTMSMTQKIRNLVNQQVRPANADIVFINEAHEHEAEQKPKILKMSGKGPELMESPSPCSPVQEPAAFSDPDPEDSGVLEDAVIPCEHEPMELNRDLGDEDEFKSNGKIESEICASKPFNEFYICPYCPSDNLNTDSNKMDVVELYYHFIFHHDYPMKCTECKVFLPEDTPTLDAHWHQCHSNSGIVISDMRFIKTQITIDPPELNLRNPPPPQKYKESSILCTDCLADNNLEVAFDTMKEFKIHQALKHPSVARSSCPLCPLVFSREPKNSEENKVALKEHLKTVHQILKKDLWRSYLCKLCGRGIKNFAKKGLLLPTRFAHNEMLHLMSRHVDLIQATYTCKAIGCSKEFNSFQKFVEHSNSNFIPNHSQVTWNTRTNYIFKLEKKQITCGLCLEGERSTFDSCNIDAFFGHLNVGHSVVFEWNAQTLETNGKIILSKAQVHIEEIAEFCEVFQGNEKEIKREISLVNGNSRTTRPPKYACPTRPNLKKMNLDAFIIHLLFHWRCPNRCTLCKAYMPLGSEAIDAHWKQYHSGVNPPPAVKFEPVLYSPGNVFRCEKCPERFMSFKDRNEHELVSHGWRSIKTENCSACNESFTSIEELRLHRAIDHPEIAFVSCYFCEEMFPAESLEGVKYLDCEALKKHILEREDHPKDDPQTMFHLCGCDLCGKVVEDPTKSSIHLRTHIMQKHLKQKLKTRQKPKAPLWCFICNKELRQMSVWEHLSKMHARNCICETCGDEMRPRTLPDHTLVKHDVIMEGFKEFSCEEQGCSYKTVYSVYLKRHVLVHHTDRQRSHKCSICEKAFFELSNLREHEERHQNKETRPFQCEICGGSYAVRNDLYIHKRLSHLNLKFPSTNRKRAKRTPVAVTYDDEAHQHN